MQLGAYLAKLRQKRGWSQRGAAQRCGLSSGYLCQLEQGGDAVLLKAGWGTVERLKKLYSEDAEDLVARMTAAAEKRE